MAKRQCPLIASVLQYPLALVPALQSSYLPKTTMTSRIPPKPSRTRERWQKVIACCLPSFGLLDPYVRKLAKFNFGVLIVFTLVTIVAFWGGDIAKGVLWSILTGTNLLAFLVHWRQSKRPYLKESQYKDLVRATIAPVLLIVTGVILTNSTSTPVKLLAEGSTLKTLYMTLAAAATVTAYLELLTLLFLPNPEEHHASKRLNKPGKLNKPRNITRPRKLKR